MNKEEYSDSLLKFMVSQFVKSEDIGNGEIENIIDDFNSMTDAIITKQKINEVELSKLAKERAERISSFLINKQKLPADRILL